MGASLAAKLEGSLACGSSLDLGLAMAGRWAIQGAKIYGQDLPPACRAATHFVRAVPVGAFAMSVGTRANVRAVAEIFDAGTQGESDSTYVRDTRDGDLGACRSAAAGDAPSPGCSAPLRVELVRIDPRGEARAKCETDGAVNECVRWSYQVFGSEVDERAAPDVIAKLVALCKAGEAHACVNARMGVDVLERRTGRTAQVDRRWLEQRECELGGVGGCSLLADRLEEEGKDEEAFRLRESACLVHDVGCAQVADLVEAGHGPPDPKQHAQYLADLRARGCLANSGECTKYALLHRKGLRTRVDLSKRAQAVVKLCEDPNTDGMACYFAAAVKALAIGVPRDLARARTLYARHCARAPVQRNLRGATCEMPKEWQ